MMSHSTPPPNHTPDFFEELADGVLNAFAAIYALFAMGMLLSHVWCHVARENWVYPFLGCIFYTGMLIFLFAFAAVYHFTRLPSYKQLRVKIHDLFVYLLLLGTYVGFYVSAYPPAKIPWMFYLILGCILAGIVVKLYSRNQYKKYSIYFYFALLWAGMWDYSSSRSALPVETTEFFLTGLVFYSIGLLFLRWHGIPWSHVLWHFWVIAGSFCHVLALNSIF
ncbi:MAG: hypothetical protein Q4D98_11365 [Planctomycetia bacterium]|nr:hypothetical protein [Planctomycetia bacterium]